MNRPVILIAPHDKSPWLIGHCVRAPSARRAEQGIVLTSVEAGEAPETTAAALRQALDDLGYRGQGLVLALPAPWCLSASIDAGQLPRRGRETALLYRLEEQLPLAAESLVADFIASDAGKRLGVCVPIGRVKPWAETLEAHGVRIDWICPLSLLIAQEGSTNPNASCIVGESSGVSWVELRDGSARNWAFVPAETTCVRMEIAHRRVAEQHGEKIEPAYTLVNVPEPLTHALGNDIKGNITVLPESAPVIATRIASKIADGSIRPWINLRRGSLASPNPIRGAPGPLRLAAASFILFTIALAVALHIRAYRYRQQAQRQGTAEIAALHEVLPNASLGVGPLRRLQSELRRLRGLAGDASAVTPHESTLQVFSSILNALPRGLRYRVLELRLGDDLLYLEGQVRTHGDADLIAQDLQKGSSLAIDAPNTQQQDGGAIAFTLTGKRRTIAGSQATEGLQATEGSQPAVAAQNPE
jgi:hypothetical protein